MQGSIRADLFFGTAYGLAVSVLAWVLLFFPPPLSTTALLLLVLAATSGTVRLRVRGLGRLSATYPAILATLVLFGPGLSALAGGLGATVSRWTRPRLGRREPIANTAFELSSVVLAASGAGAVYFALGGTIGALGAWPGVLVPLGGHAACHALVRLGLASWSARLYGRRIRIWRGAARAIPRHALGLVAGCGTAWMFGVPEARILLVAGIVVSMILTLNGIRRDERHRRRREQKRADDLFHCVTRALAMTIEAKDGDTQRHLRRVERLCLDLGRRLDLPPPEIEALAAAAVLHDIGKVAIPEKILTKPGRLTPTEMERIKTHPRIGADILQAIPFPYPLAPIVRHHHERWDGAGYPAGLAGERIPLGSRILAVVDSYDALTTDRPYRRALPHAEAVAFLRRESDRMFDGTVVESLIGHLESRGVAAEAAPDNELEALEEEHEAVESFGSGNLPLAQRELQALYDISRAMGYGLKLEEYLTLVACKLASLVPYQSLVVYFLEPEEKMLRAGFALGKAGDRLRLMTIPLGERLSGWAALQQRAFMGQDHLTPLERDGSRSDLEEWDDDDEICTLNSTLVAPMFAGERVLGVITLYDHADRRYMEDDRRSLIRVAGYVAQVVERLDGRVTTGDASLTDPLTGVPNARFLWLETAHRISQTAGGAPGFGLLAFRLMGLEKVTERLGDGTSDRLLCQIARRFAASSEPSETLVRFGQDLFMVLTGVDRPGHLVRRWHDLAEDVRNPALVARDGTVLQVRLSAAHAIHPADGANLDELLGTLDARLTLSEREGRTVIPFRPPRQAAATGGRPG